MVPDKAFRGPFPGRYATATSNGAELTLLAELQRSQLRYRVDLLLYTQGAVRT